MIPLFKPYMPSKLPELSHILNSGALAYGKFGRKYEEELKKYIGCKSVQVTSSYNSAFLVLIKALDLQYGDEVIASPMSCLASSQPLASMGLKVVWADIDPSTGTLNPEDVKKKISNKTKAIFHNHFCGYVGHVNEIINTARHHGIFIIDDGIEGFGSTYEGKKMGDFGSDATLLSFQTVRLPNMIDGGGIATNNTKLIERISQIRDYGINRKHFRDSLNEIRPDCDITLAGFGATPSDVNSYVGLLQMEVIDELLDKQRNNFQNWQKITKEMGIQSLSEVPNTRANGWVYGILSKNKKEDILYWRDKGFYASGVHIPNNYYSLFGGRSHMMGINDFYSKFIALPCGWWVNYDTDKFY